MIANQNRANDILRLARMAKRNAEVSLDNNRICRFATGRHYARNAIECHRMLTLVHTDAIEGFAVRAWFRVFGETMLGAN
jgi:hypothetical protein